MGWNARVERAYLARVRKLNRTILETDLTNAANGGAQTVPVGVLPAGAEILTVAFKLNTQFTGGGASAVTVTIGDAISATRIGSAIDAFGGTAGGAYIKPTTVGPGVGPYPNGDTINAIFTPDGAHNLAALTAGSIEIDITFAVPDSNPNR
jgi:hypothetical protein